MLLPAVACCCHRVWHANNAAGAVLLAALTRPRPAPRRAAFLIANTNRERAPARQNLKTPFCLHRGTHTHPTHIHREITHTQWFTHIGTGIRCTLHVRSARLVSTGSSYTNIQSNVARNQIGINSKHKQFLATHTHTRIHRGTIKVTDTTTRVEPETETESSTELSD